MQKNWFCFDFLQRLLCIARSYIGNANACSTSLNSELRLVEQAGAGMDSGNDLPAQFWIAEVAQKLLFFNCEDNCSLN